MGGIVAALNKVHLEGPALKVGPRCRGHGQSIQAQKKKNNEGK